MMFSKSCEYAIKAAIHICIESKKGKRLSIGQIAEAIESPVPFTGKILQTLARHEIISSAKGPGGGFFISENSRPVKIMEVVELIDGKQAFERCGLGLKECNENHPCPIHNEFKSYSAKLKNLLQNKNIQDLSKEIAAGRAFLSND